MIELYVCENRPEGEAPGMYSPAVDHVSFVRRWQSNKDVDIIPLLV